MLHKNLEWKLISLVLAFCLWAYVAVNEKAGEKAFRVPIQVARIPDDLALTSEPGSAVVRLSGDREILEIAAHQVQAKAYPTASRPGKVEAKVEALHPPELTLVKVVPSEITLRLERVVSRDFPITCQLQGQPDPGYILGKPHISPTYVQVFGSQSAVSKVNRVVVRVDTSYAMLGQPQSGLLTPVDAAGRDITGLKMEPLTATVTVPVQSSIASKLLPVFPSIEGDLPEGFRVKRITVTPPLVTAAGDASRIRALESVSTLPLSLEKATSSFTRRIPLVVPPGVASLSERVVRVRVEVVPEPPSEEQPSSSAAE
jgi:YbbR domain-containing protein